MDFKKGLIISLKHLGDIVPTTCVLPLLKKEWPAMEIQYLVNSLGVPLVAEHPLTAKVHHTDRNLGPAANWALFRQLRREKFDLVLDYSEGDRGAFWCLVTGARERVGYRASPSHLFRNLCHTRLLPDRTHVFDRHISACHAEALALLGRPSGAAPLPSLRPSAGSRGRAAAFLRENGLSPSRPYVLTHFAVPPRTLWPKAHCLEALNWLAAEVGPVITLSSRAPAELAFTAELAAEAVGPVVDSRGRLDLDTLMALVGGARLVVAADSLIGHLAGALEVPVASLFGPESDVHWAPRGPRVRVVHVDRPCRPCVTGRCRPGGLSGCLEDLSFAEYVRPALEELLEHQTI